VFDFVVTNGRGISSLQKTGTSGLVDTYTFTYNDGTKATFTVTNGDKGDKGDNAYIWVKYASQEPTASSNSFGDLPDDWMGVYFGTAPTAPTNWRQYKWYRIKGEKGDTGEPATIVRAEITYQASDSGTIIPSGSWGTSVPPVTPGRYLWTRQVLQFNTGNPVTSYSVSRFGIDGTGAVSTVAGIAPDSDGNVPLTAENVKALPIGGGTMEGEINMNGQALTGLNEPKSANEPATKAYVDKIDWFGVGTAIPANADLNTYTINGKYYCPNDSTAKTLLNAPTTSNFVLFVFDRTGSGTVTHLAITLTGRMFLRGKSSSSWRDWVDFARRSDISKDMMPGTEYSTLERSAGKTVYAKRVSQEFTTEFGDPNGASIKDYTIAHGIENFDKLLRYTAIGGSYALPYFNNAGGSITVKNVDATNINIRCNKAYIAVPVTLEVDLYYTKTE
jgi:hypothetical protein